MQLTTKEDFLIDLLDRIDFHPVVRKALRERLSNPVSPSRYQQLKTWFEDKLREKQRRERFRLIHF